MGNKSKKASLILAATILGTTAGSFLVAPSVNAAIESNVVKNDINWDTPSAPAAPSQVNARAGSEQVVLTWAPVDNAKSYNVRRYNVVNNTYDSFKANETTVLTTGVTDAVYTDTSVTNGQIYGYVVNAVYGDGQMSQLSMPVIATPMSGNVKDSIVLQYKSGTAAGSNSIQPTFNIMNTSGTPVNLSDIRVRYYFNGGKDLTAKNFSASNVSFGSRNIEPNFVSLEKTYAQADSYIELLFNAEAGIIRAGGETGPMTFTIQKNQSGSSQANDYSYKDTSELTEWNKVAVYYQGDLVWGTEPDLNN
ncbi:fibronectin type 3 domain-containing protein [Paenibacillus sp. SORGH_AS306]|uniref:cellulose binding domain-containing protein n=1 Tax=unclassified Paenibacillus TaxID=185978 RepID=UPI00278073B7|nr:MULTISPECIES: cellulose binding domain-containing protein [unclassified Paenibacillus]MDQ1234002.1 fibronectin type 3 domain-containing protein [Paenibacillus sp. SORGH_AS_0306]MDR6111047.1 fibronectin type 3 domain-containing protein [Paenibacillus sp. SORGH_AS_0338]